MNGRIVSGADRHERLLSGSEIIRLFVTVCQTNPYQLTINGISDGILKSVEAAIKQWRGLRLALTWFFTRGRFRTMLLVAATRVRRSRIGMSREQLGTDYE
jgi:hypothetical protein